MPVLNVALCPLLTQNVVTSLGNVGIVSVLDFVSANLEDVVVRSGIPYKDLCAIRKILLAQHAPFPFNGVDLYEDILNNARIIPTTCTSLNALLDGGFYSGELIEIIGKAATGKTQICLSTSVSVANTLQQNVFYIDTRCGFDVQRIQEILEAQNLQEDGIVNVCKRIKSCPVFDVFELLSVLEFLHNSLSDQADPFYGNVKLVVVDSVASVLSPIVGGQQMSGHSYLMHVAQSLKTLASEFGIVVLTTNSVTHDERGTVTPSLGRSWRSVPNVRLLISRKDSAFTSTSPTDREVFLMKSNRQQIHGRCKLVINDQGIRDV